MALTWKRVGKHTLVAFLLHSAVQIYDFVPARQKSWLRQGVNSLGIGAERIVRLLLRILGLNFARFLRELCFSIIIILLLYSLFLLLRF